MAELRAAEAPAPGPGEVRIRTVASGVSAGTELLVYRGEVSPELPLDLPTLEGSFGFPIKHGYAAVGRVLEVGPEVPGRKPEPELQPGVAVFVHHPHQSMFTVPASAAVPLPAGLDPELGVFAANLETALNILHDAPVRLGETAAVFGQGVVGLLVTQLLRLAGVAVLAVEPHARRVQLSRALGAEAVFEPQREPGLEPGLVEELRAASGGRGVDVAFETSGSPAALQEAIDSVAQEGTVVVASWYGTKPVSLQLGGNFHRGRVRLVSSQVGRLNPQTAPRWDHRRRLQTALGLLERLRLGDLISHRLPFDRAPEAHRLLDESPGEVVQLVLDYGGGAQG